MVFTCQEHKSLQSQYIAEMFRREVRKIQFTVVQIAHMMKESKQGRACWYACMCVHRGFCCRAWPGNRFLRDWWEGAVVFAAWVWGKPQP